MAIYEQIKELKEALEVSIVAHYYQKNEVFEMADFTGDSLQLAQWAAKDNKPNLIFCGVGFMGQSVKLLAPKKRVLMPKIACCAMARMIDEVQYDNSVKALNEAGITNEEIMPITYINSSAQVKARVGKMGGMVCTSSNAKIIIKEALKSGKKILFIPDRCLGQNIARDMGLKSKVIGLDSDLKDADILCYNGFCSVHQLFEVSDVKFYKEKFPNIKIVTHPECKPEVCEISDFVGSTAQMIKYIKSLPLETPVAVGTEYNLVKRLREKNTYVLSSTKPQCPTMNETTLKDLHNTLISLKDKDFSSEVLIDEDVRHWANIALKRMFEL
ncbi:MAG: quinolinate synthase NadA [Sulfurospirillaceae bacterium]|nr:quinolinate synthase NadA [Sulfurospirillaceae bacterium]MDY0237536.1 quinolinate synthase NadA [Campylobacterales bacterium]